MFILFGIISLYSGIESSSEIHLLPMDEKGKKRQLINTCASVIPLLSLLFNILALTYNREDKYITTLNPKYEEWKPKAEENTKFYKKPSFFVAIISFALILIAGLSGHLFETSGGTVAVNDFTLNKQMTEVYCDTELNGNTHVIEDKNLTYGVTLYKPKAASSTNKAPVIVVMPGFTRTKATMSQYCIEFSKRGAVVFCIDPGCQGATTASGYDEDKLEKVSFTTKQSQNVHAPIINELKVSIECRAINIVEVGSHTQITGEIINIVADEDVIEDGNVSMKLVNPIAYDMVLHDYFKIGEKIDDAFECGLKFIK